MSQLGIDVGGTKVALRLERQDAPDGEGTRQTVLRWPEPAALGTDLAVLAEAVAAVGIDPDDPVTSVGVAMPATLDRAGRVRGWPNRPFWQGLDLGEALAELLPGATVRTADDGDLAALAEADAADCRDLVHIGVGTGIGGGIVLDGRISPGTARGSCEVGHLIVDRAGERCDCGRHGCVQSVASGRAVLRRASARLDRPVDFDELRTAWLDSTAWAVEVVTDGADAVATAIVGLCELTHPQLVTVGGGFAAGLPGYVDAVTRRAAELARPAGPDVRIAPAALGGMSSLDGAVLLARA
ncbi:ROK family protein [Streptomyces sp. NPDC006482]|uniref:ROK family protein n=1 Tax=Streptomyces sp. NPDC006482 TaxID=3154306 RepID=UPI0033A3B0A8